MIAAPMHADVFRHLPQLRDQIVPPEQSQVRATPERMAYWDAQAAALGLGAAWRSSDAALAASRRDMLLGWAAQEELWIFGYGSLLWDPGFHFDEVRRADLDGYQRRFSLRIEVGRGTPECPALMLGLEPGGRCQGLAFRIAPDRREVETAAVWCREMIQGHYRPERRPAMTPQGPVDVLLFRTDTGHAQYVGDLPLGEAAATIRTGRGLLGTNREYLEILAARLDAFGIDDPHIRQLVAEVKNRDNGNPD